MMYKLFTHRSVKSVPELIVNRVQLKWLETHARKHYSTWWVVDSLAPTFTVVARSHPEVESWTARKISEFHSTRKATA